MKRSSAPALSSLLRALAAVASVLVLASGCRFFRTPPTNVLVIVVDTLRADRLGAYGNSDGLTPFLDQLAAGGTVFVDAYATSSWTCPSVASLFTSRYPVQHKVVTFGSPLARDEVTLAERLSAAGFVSGGFSANFRLLKPFGYAQGFRTWRADEKMPGGLEADVLSAQGLAWLDGAWVKSAPWPAFLYFQFMEPHSPYTPRPAYFARVVGNDGVRVDEEIRTMLRLRRSFLSGLPPRAEDVPFLRRRYDAEVAEIDDRLRDLFAALRERGFLDNALVVVTSDHGEEFGEHGVFEHGKSLYEDVVRVPLIVAGTGVAAGRRVDQRVSLVDLAPTLLDLLELPAEPRFEGRSLAPMLRRESGAPAPADVLLELYPAWVRSEPKLHEQGIIRGDTKVLVRPDGSVEAYDLADDPAETRPRSAAADELRTALDENLLHLRERQAAGGEVAPLDEGTKEKLRALGYAVE